MRHRINPRPLLPLLLAVPLALGACRSTEGLGNLDGSRISADDAGRRADTSPLADGPLADGPLADGPPAGGPRDSAPTPTADTAPQAADASVDSVAPQADATADGPTSPADDAAIDAAIDGPGPPPPDADVDAQTGP